MPHSYLLFIRLILAVAVVMPPELALADTSLGGPGTGSMGGVKNQDPDQDPSRTGLVKEPTAPGQERWYEAGNRNLTLQALYLTNKIDALKVLDRGPWDKLGKEQGTNAQNVELSRAADLLGDSCTDEERVKEPDGSPNFSFIKECRNRFYRVQEPFLRALRERIKQNELSSAQLANVQGKLGPSAILGAAPVGIPGSKIAAVPYVTTIEDLKKINESKEFNLERTAEPKDYEGWANVLLAPPKEVDFLKSEELTVKLTPGDKESTIRSIALDKNGNPGELDDVAGAGAKDAYKRKTASQNGAMSSLELDMINFKKLKEQRAKDAKSPKPAAIGDDQIALFNNVRVTVINAVQVKLKIPSKSVVVFPGAPSSGQQAGQRAPSGTEQVDPGNSQVPSVSIKYQIDGPSSLESEIDSMIDSTNHK